MYRVTRRLGRGVEGPRGCLSSPRRSNLFKYRIRIGRIRHGLSLGAENQEVADIAPRPVTCGTSAINISKRGITYILSANCASSPLQFPLAPVNLTICWLRSIDTWNYI
jgi:hypothetical protein